MEQAEDMLLRRYLQTYGPATAEDFSLWTGISLTEARQIWKRKEASFASVDVEGWEAAVLRKDLTELLHTEHERPLVRLLPYFDSYLLGHKERQHLVSLNHHSKIYRSQGWIAPVVLVDGRATAIWEYARERNVLRVKVGKLEPLSRQIITAIHEEAQDLGRFLGTSNVDVQIA